MLCRRQALLLEKRVPGQCVGYTFPYRVMRFFSVLLAYFRLSGRLPRADGFTPFGVLLGRPLSGQPCFGGLIPTAPRIASGFPTDCPVQTVSLRPESCSDGLSPDSRVFAALLRQRRAQLPAFRQTAPEWTILLQPESCSDASLRAALSEQLYSGSPV